MTIHVFSLGHHRRFCLDVGDRLASTDCAARGLRAWPSSDFTWSSWHRWKHLGLLRVVQRPSWRTTVRMMGNHRGNHLLSLRLVNHPVSAMDHGYNHDELGGLPENKPQIWGVVIILPHCSKTAIVWVYRKTPFSNTMAQKWDGSLMNGCRFKKWPVDAVVNQ